MKLLNDQGSQGQQSEADSQDNRQNEKAFFNSPLGVVGITPTQS